MISFRTLLLLAFAAVISSCTRSYTIEGTVRDVAEHTLTVKTKELGVVTFLTREAKMRCPAGIHRGSPVEVTISGDITDGFSVADRVVAPEAYNLLIGRWVAPCEENPELLCGFELLEDGEMIEIGDHSIPYNCWRLKDDTISVAESDENLDIDLFDFAHHWHIEELNDSILVISYCGKTKTLVRSERK